MYIVRTCWRIVLLALFGITPFVVSADIVIYTSGTGNAGQTGDATQTYTLRDATLQRGVAASGTRNEVQVRGSSFPPPQGPNVALLSFDNLFSGTEGSKIGSGADIDSATLWIYQNTTAGGATSLTLRGLSTGASDWVENEATYAGKSGTANGWDGSGGDIQSALTTDYGAYAVTAGNSGWIMFDVTDALKDYKDGNIGGLVLTIDGNFSDGFAFDSDENDSGNSAVLRVDQIPEPAVASFMLIGSAYMLVNRRMRQRTEAENQTASL